MSGQIWLKKGRDRPVRQRHPWVFSGAVGRVAGDPADGDVVDVHDVGNNWLARGLWNGQSQIVARLLTWNPDEAIDRTFWRDRLERAIAGRAALAQDPETTAYRLVHAESDGLPGLVVDRYGDFLAVQFLVLGVDRRREMLVDLLRALLDPRGIYERSDVEVREKEGLEQQTGVLAGETPPEALEVVENGLRFWVGLRAGQKTGFYLDQRENRARLPAFCEGAEVLDAFAYTGAFGVYAAAGDAARVTFLDSSSVALEVAGHHLAHNGHDPARHAFVEGDVFSVLRAFRSEGRSFDVVVLDPPKFAPTQRDVKRASRAYKDVNLLAFQLLRPGGILFSTSCSGAVDIDLFQKILFGAAVDAERDARIIGTLYQASDHPVALTFPEGAYLKGLICRVW
jgi:23S rRNA (cytosine1962-C5)-methyltransferase